MSSLPVRKVPSSRAIWSALPTSAMYLQNRQPPVSLQLARHSSLLQLTAPEYACKQPGCAQECAAPATEADPRSLRALCSLKAHQLVG